MEVENAEDDDVVGARRRWRKTDALFDGAFFLYAAAASLWFAVALYRDTRGTPMLELAWVILLWATVAYLVLPRLHRVLTTLYVPNYYIGRARTGDGLLGDPVNIAFNGGEAELKAAMEKAGWTRADPITLESSWKIITSTLTKRSYKKAPVSTLKLFDRAQDFAYQQEVAGSPSKRHHIRFWQTPADWPLPGGTRVDWLGAATFDKAVGLSLFTLQVTHKVAADTDTERDHVVTTLKDVDPTLPVEVLEDFSTAYHARNGGGDQIHTDGDLPVITVPGTAPTQPGAAALARSEPARPAALYLSVAIVALQVLAHIVRIVFTVIDPAAAGTELLQGLDMQPTPDLLDAAALLLGTIQVATGLAFLVLGILLWRGSRWARVLLMLLSAQVTVPVILRWFEGGAAELSGLDLLTVFFAIVLLLTLSSESVSDYTEQVRARRIQKRQRPQSTRARSTPA